MSHNRPLKLKVANSRDFIVPGFLLSGLILVSALLSTHPFAMTLCMSVVIISGWGLYLFRRAKLTDETLISVIFPDGSIRLESAVQKNTEGFLQGQQWCNSQFAVLRYVTRGQRHSMVLLSAQQNADNYRRLLVWLRQDLLIKNEDRVQS